MSSELPRTDLFLVIPIPGTVLADADQARSLRERYLEGQPVNGRPVLIDLRTFEAMNATAIEELLLKWLKATRDARGSVVVCLWITSPDVLKTVNLVLRDEKSQAAYAWTSLDEPTIRLFDGTLPVLIGGYTKTNVDTLSALLRAGGGITARELMEQQPIDITAASTATNRLIELVTKGLAMRSQQAGRVGDLFIFPFSPRGLEEIQARMSAHPALMSTA